MRPVLRRTVWPCLNVNMTRRAFTLVELLVVISIIGMLSTIAVTNMSSSQMASRNARRMADITQIAKALDLYWKGTGPLS